MKSNQLILLALVILAACKPQKVAFPTRSEIENAENRSSAYLQKLSADDRKSYNDLKEDWMKHEQGDQGAMQKLYAQAVLHSQTILGKMGYGTLFNGVVDGRTKDALIQYQKNNEIFPSGNVDPITYFSLTEDDKVLEDRLVYTASFFFFSKDWNHYFSATGAWDYRNKDSNEVVSSSIECDKSRGICSEADAAEMGLLGITTVVPSTTDFKLTKWDDFEIRAENEVPCEKDEIVIDRDEKTVTMHMISTEPDSVSCRKTMGDIPVLDAHLKDAQEIGKGHRDATQKKRAALYQFSEDATKLMDNNAK